MVNRIYSFTQCVDHIIEKNLFFTQFVNHMIKGIVFLNPNSVGELV